MPLLVYKSSAGSGKTTTLVNEYLKITLRNPHIFSHVLAITFTNNAANEMKERILLALEKIISGEAWNSKRWQPLIEHLGFEKHILIKNAEELQRLLLHRYDEFAVSTIDSFVHRIIRTFTRDVKLPQNFEVIIEKDDFVPDIVEELFSKVGRDKALTELMINFVMSQIDDEKNHDLGRLINQFVEKQLDEEGFSYLKKLQQLSAEDFILIIKKLSGKLRQLTSIITTNAKQALDLIHANGLEKADFYQTGSGIYNFFEKSSTLNTDNHLTLNSYVRKTIEEAKWTSGKANAEAKNAIDKINVLLTEYFIKIMEVVPEYFQLKQVDKKIYALALSNQIRNIFEDYTERTQKVHISEFNKRISNEISGQPVPFIYERLGIKYQHFLIDEFQDTSVLQWQNLLPLVEESLANENFNLLVGDAKQAIYRFRNGEVELFVKLPELYTNNPSQQANATENLLKSSYTEINLNKNWRSLSELIEFNNRFFDVLKNNSEDRIRKIYDHHKQIVPAEKEKKGGFVSIKLINTEKPEDYAAKRLIEIEGYVNKMLDAGYKQGEICVLTKTNSAATEIATHLIENKFDVITSESLLLTNSAKVRLVVAFLRLLNQPGVNSILAEFLQNLSVVKNINNFHSLYSKTEAFSKNDLKGILENAGLSIDIEKMAALPVFEIAESVILQLNLFETPDTYLRFFLDFVFLTQENGRGSVDTFLELWDKKKSKLYVSMPDGGNAIQIMTIHKAKGLKFEAVIVDIADRGNKKGKSEYWTDIEIEGLEELKVGLFSITKDIENIGLKEVYDEENEKTRLDFINMVYVAFTRPVSALFLTGHTGGSKKEKFSELVVDFLKENGTFDFDSDCEFEIGKLAEPYRDEEKDDKESIIINEIISSSWEDKLSVAPADEVYWEAIDSKPAKVYGNLIHDMLSGIVTKNDIEIVINAHLHAATIDLEEAGALKITLEKVVNHPELLKYFSDDVYVKNETELLDQSGGIAVFQRPDRVVLHQGNLVVIDYKTGEKERKHIKQLENYARIFRQMGYNKLVLKLVYIGTGVEVIDIPQSTAGQPQLF